MHIKRGNTFSQTVDCENFSIQKGDIIKIGVKSYEDAPDFALLKVLEFDEAKTSFDFNFTSEETKKLVPSEYEFEILYLSSDGEIVETIYKEDLTVEGSVFANDSNG